METMLLAWCQGRITSDGGCVESPAIRLNRPSPCTFDVSHTPCFVSVSVPKLTPLATSGLLSPTLIVTRIRCSSSVICRASISR
ncbi:MAG: hypothetical protein DMF87_22985 [Acidobacteria bacterium]|nr:MAG: hypothetical protein DMF87_22985 [Acidobacteriota bacterium]